MGLSIRAYAAHRGVSHVAVIKAIDTGRITPLPDGTIDPQTADAQWEHNTLNPRSKMPRQTAAVAPEPELPSTPPSAAGGTSLLQARTANEVLKAQIRKIELAEKKNTLVDRAKAIALVFKLARAERDAWLNFSSRVSAPIAARLGVDEHALHIAIDTAVRDYLDELGAIAVRVDE